MFVRIYIKSKSDSKEIIQCGPINLSFTRFSANELFCHHPQGKNPQNKENKENKEKKTDHCSKDLEFARNYICNAIKNYLGSSEIENALILGNLLISSKLVNNDMVDIVHDNLILDVDLLASRLNQIGNDNATYESKIKPFRQALLSNLHSQMNIGEYKKLLNKLVWKHSIMIDTTNPKINKIIMDCILIISDIVKYYIPDKLLQLEQQELILNRSSYDKIQMDLILNVPCSMDMYQRISSFLISIK